ncbi:Cytochrome P450 [Mycena kentingensis (nom. inval.)]|nr:Cytochrome P450 [Mycena kentingensis (nom. inval.)]
MSFLNVLIAGPLIFAALRILRRTRDPGLEQIPGPPSPSWLFGNMLQLFLPPYGTYDDLWRKNYGSVYRYQGSFGRDCLLISDPVALQHVLNSHNGEFELAPIFDTLFRWLFGDRNMAVLKGTEHRAVRTAWNSAFTAGAVRQYQPILEKIAHEISERLDKTEAASIDMCPLLSRATVRSTTEVVFGCHVEDLGADFLKSNSSIMASSATQSPTQILIDELGTLLPPWLFRQKIRLPITASKALRKHVELAEAEGWKLVNEKTHAAKEGHGSGVDVYSNLLRLDTNKAIKPDDIVAQTSVMMIGGEDTTAYTLVWSLYELARNPELQSALRAEIHERPRTNRGEVAYDNMPLLNATIKETLRMYPIRPWTYRMASKDTFIPLSQKVVSTTGERLDRIFVKKGQPITLGFAAYQKLESRWGADSEEFNPSRWIENRVPQSDAISPYANLLAFSGGPHACVGWRLAILEMQVILTEIIDKYTFHLSEAEPIEPRYMTNLMPTDKEGMKRAVFRVERV